MRIWNRMQNQSLTANKEKGKKNVNQGVSYWFDKIKSKVGRSNSASSGKFNSIVRFFVTDVQLHYWKKNFSSDSSQSRDRKNNTYSWKDVHNTCKTNKKIEKLKKYTRFFKFIFYPFFVRFLYLP